MTTPPQPAGALLTPMDVGVAVPGLETVQWDGHTPPPGRDVLDRVEVFVVPYDAGSAGLEPLRLGMPRLRWVQALSAGTEHLDGLVPDGATLCNARGVHDASTSELAVALTLASLRRIPEAVLDREGGRWAHARHTSLADRRVLVLGWGAIGQAVGARLAPFECEVVAVARTARDGVQALTDLEDLLTTADVVVVTVPLTPDTRHLLDARRLALLPDGALVVNVARGAVVDTDALVAELRAGRLRAGLDVTDPEPPPPGHPLWTVPGLLLTPHVGGNTTAFEPRARRLLADQLGRWATGRPLANVVAAAG